MEKLLLLALLLSSASSLKVLVAMEHTKVDVEEAGCWARVGDDTLANDLEGTTDVLDEPASSRASAKAKCARAAIEQDKKVFGLFHGGECFTWNTTEHYKLNGEGSCPKDGRGGTNSYNVYQLVSIPEVTYTNLGCWNDRKGQRAVPGLESSSAIFKKPYLMGESAIRECAAGALARGFKVFVVQDRGWCGSSQNAHLTYDNYGEYSGYCPRDGTGGPLINNAYSLEKVIAGFNIIRENGTVESQELVDDSSGNGEFGLAEELSSNLEVCQGNPCVNGWCSQASRNDYNCTCQIGFELDKERNTCVDQNECDVPEMCKKGNCENRVGTYYCGCRQGYKLDRETRTCVDINECETGNHACKFNAECENTIGHYRCKCKEGLVGNGITSCKLEPSFAKDFAIECLSNRIKLHVPLWFIKMFGDMHLNDPNCRGKEKPHEYLFTIREDLSTCGNKISTNKTHIFYKNTLTNEDFLKRAGDLVSGTPVFVDWMCIYPTEDLLVMLQRGRHFLAGAGILRLGTADESGEYMASKQLPPYISVSKGGILAKTDAPGGKPVTDEYGAVVPLRDPQTREILTGPEGGRGFIPKMYENGTVQLNENGNVIAETYENGSLISPSAAPPGIAIYDPDERQHYFEGGPPRDFNDSELSPVIGSEEIPGDPVLEPIKLENGSIAVPGFNASLPDDITSILEENGGGSGLRIHDPELQKIHLLNGSGFYPVSLWPFTDATYMTVRTKFIFDTQEILHLRVMVDTTDTNMAVVLDHCWGTASKDPGSSPSTNLIKDGCRIPGAVHDTVTITSNGEWRTADFHTQVFSFKDHNTTYIHCRVDLCNKKTSDTCKPNCAGKDRINRKKRSVGNEKMISIEAQTELTLGPFHIRRPGELIISDNDNVEKNSTLPGDSEARPDNVGAGITAAIVFVCVANALLLITVCACATYCVRRRRNGNLQSKAGVPLNQPESPPRDNTGDEANSQLL